MRQQRKISIPGGGSGVEDWLVRVVVVLLKESKSVVVISLNESMLVVV